MLIGTLYGYSRIPVEHSCVPSETTTGVIAERRERVESIQYLVATNEGCIVLTTTSPIPIFDTVEHVQLSGGTQRTLSDSREFSAGYANYLVRRGVTSTWQFPELRALEHTGTREPVRLMQLQSAANEKIRETFSEPDASIVGAMLLGERGTIPEHVVANFRKTGVSHVLAISGLHISLVAAMLLGVLTVLPLSPWLRSIILLFILWSYIFLIDTPVSAVRAGWFWTIAVIGYRLHLLVSLPTVLVITVAMLVSMSPTIWLDVGFQLSVSAVTGIFLAHFLTGSWRAHRKNSPVAAIACSGIAWCWNRHGTSDCLSLRHSNAQLTSCEHSCCADGAAYTCWECDGPSYLCGATASWGDSCVSNPSSACLGYLGDHKPFEHAWFTYS